MALLITPIPLMHPYAAYLLLPVLLCFAMICTQELRQQLKYAAYSLIIAFFVCLLLNYIVATRAPTISIGIITLSAYLFIGLAILIITSIRGKIPTKINAVIDRFSKGRQAITITAFLLLLYFASLLLWFSGSLTFDFGGLNLFGYVPWFLYPVKLGVIGILAILATCILFTSSKYRSRELVALLASALLMIFVSRLVSTIQMSYTSQFTFNPNSWFSEAIRQTILGFREERMFELFKVPLAILAAIVLGENILIRTKLKKTKLSNYLVVSGLISLILISGMASTLLGFEYYNNLTETNQISPPELEIINDLRDKIYADGKSIIISPRTPTSYLDFTGATAIVTESPAAWAAKSPELPLFVTRYSETTPTYVYLDQGRDYAALSDYAGNYLEHISNLTQTCLENSEVTIKAFSNGSIPVSHSSAALIVPFDESAMAISRPITQEESKQNIALALFFEKSLQPVNIYKDPITYHDIEQDDTATFNGMSSYIRINGTDTNFEKISVEFMYRPLDLSSNQVIVGKFDWGTPPRKSWEIVQYGKRIAFKISPDGANEEVLLSSEILTSNTQYTIRNVYDGTSMEIFLNNKIIASKPYQEGIFQSNTDLIIGAELYNDKPTAFAKMTLSYVRVLTDVPSATEPIFYAYDLLSSTGLNFTTTLSNDNKSYNHETQVLPYDDRITYEMLTKLDANQQTANTRYVVILNTNGYGPFLNLFGNITSDSFTATGILTNNYSTMQPSIDVPVITLNKNTEVKAQYVNNSLSSPFIMTTTRDQFTLIYINVYPLIQQNQLFNPTPIQTLTEILGNYMEIYDETAVSPWFYEPGLLFSGFEASGTIQVMADSVASIKLQENSAVRTKSGTYYNISTLGTERYKTIQIDSSEITVQGGYGFYTTLIAYNPSITLQNNQTTAIDITGNATFLIRQPEISVNGRITFENFHMLHPPTIYTDGRSTTLSGDIALGIYVSDEATIALPYKFNSPITVKYEKPLMAFDEIKSFMLMLPYIVLILALAIAILLVQRFKVSDTDEPINYKNSKRGFKQNYLTVYKHNYLAVYKQNYLAVYNQTPLTVYEQNSKKNP
jgi:hypothetical protein